MDIKGSGKKDLSSPTPNNTPRNAAPIQQQAKKGGQGPAADLGARLSDLAVEQENKVEIPEPLGRRIKALKNLQDKHAELEAKFREEILALEAKYLAIYKPLYDKRSEIVNGKVEPTPEEYEREDSDLDEEVGAKLTLLDEDKKAAGKKEDIKGIPEFWATALKNYPLINETITEQDHDPLKHLIDIRITYSNNNLAFTIEFEFSPNPYFTNQVLTKTYHLVNNVDPAMDDVVFASAEGCQINWKEGKNLTVKVETKKQKNKGNKKTRVVKKEVPQETFFRFFTPPTPPEDEEEEDEEEMDDEALGLEEKIEIDFEIGEVLKTKIVPHAIDWYTGKALEYDEDYMDDEEGEYYDDEDDDLEPEEDDDDDDVAPTVSNPGEKPAECAQQ